MILIQKYPGLAYWFYFKGIYNMRKISRRKKYTNVVCNITIN